MEKVVAVALMLLAASGATAQQADLVQCSKFNGDVMRANCLDAIAAYNKSATAALVIMPPAPIVPPAPPTKAELCQAEYVFAMEVMKERQAGRPMPEMIALAGKNQASLALVKEAYQTRIGLTGSQRLREIEQFGNTHFADCLEP